jgi:hypothetical protein
MESKPSPPKSLKRKPDPVDDSLLEKQILKLDSESESFYTAAECASSDENYTTCSEDRSVSSTPKFTSFPTPKPETTDILPSATETKEVSSVNPVSELAPVSEAVEPVSELVPVAEEVDPPIANHSPESGSTLVLSQSNRSTQLISSESSEPVAEPLPALSPSPVLNPS